MKQETYECLYCFANRTRQWLRLNTKFYLQQRRRYKWIECLEYEFYATHREARGHKILFFSDLHLSGLGHDDYIVDELLSYIGLVEPDIILLGGDMVGYANSIGYVEKFLSLLSGLGGQKFAVGGNWEGNKDWLGGEFWVKLYQSYGIRYLRDELYDDGIFSIHGLGDISTSHNLSQSKWLRGDRFRIMLSHSPDSILATSGKSVSSLANLALCGHTHGGQIRLPLYGAIYSSSSYGRWIDYGLYRRRNTNSLMLISSGLNSLSFPIRFNCPREALLITLT